MCSTKLFSEEYFTGLRILRNKQTKKEFSETISLLLVLTSSFTAYLYYIEFYLLLYVQTLVVRREPKNKGKERK